MNILFYFSPPMPSCSTGGPVQVEVKAVPVSQKKLSMQQDNMRKLQRLPGATAAIASCSSSSSSSNNSSCSSSSCGVDLTFGGLPAPTLEATYEPVIVKEARYIAITMMKVKRREHREPCSPVIPPGVLLLYHQV